MVIMPRTLAHLFQGGKSIFCRNQRRGRWRIFSPWLQRSFTRSTSAPSMMSFSSMCS
jgi:hypothetical protein